MPTERPREQSDLSLIGRALLRRIWVIVLCFVVATAAAVLVTVLSSKQYAGTAALLSRASAAVEPQRVVDTNLQLLSLPAVAERTAEELPGVTSEGVEEAVETKQQGESDIILVRATASEPSRAAELANAFARAFIAFRGGAGAEENLQTGRPELVDRATPEDTPVSPKPVKNIVFGALIGIVVGIGLALLLEQFDRRVKRREDLTEVTGYQVLGAIPKREAFDAEHLGREPLAPVESEVFRMLRANLRYFKARGDLRSVLVTSAQAGEGKTLVSLGLALAGVISGERVLLLEADMRDPTLARLLSLSNASGLSETLGAINAGSWRDAVTSLRAADLVAAIGDESRTLDVLPAGAVPPNPTELIESPGMKELLSEAEGSYDFVVVDTPPALVVSDAIPLISITSGVLAVSGLGVGTRDSAADLVELLDRLDARVLGLVANFSVQATPTYGEYGYGTHPQPDKLDAAAKEKRERESAQPTRSNAPGRRQRRKVGREP